LILSSATGLRGANRAIETFFIFFDFKLSSPCWYTGRFWLLRLGYYKLTRQKEQAEDWVWIIDHTVQIGSEKCLIILGIRLSSLPEDRCLIHKDVEPIVLEPVKKSNGDIVYEQLKTAINKTGVPREIVADYGTDIKSGIDRFCIDYQQTNYVYDIKHKIASILKKKLANDQVWNEFNKKASQTKKRVQQTLLSALAPPNQRSKARYMNIDKLVKWGINTINFLDKYNEESEKDFPFNQVEQKISWITTYRDELKEWQEMIQVIETAESFVKKRSLYKNCHQDLIEELSFNGKTRLGHEVYDELLMFIENESQKAKDNERLLGSSEIIESVIGKLKNLEQDQANSGFTALLLSIAAIVGPTVPEVIQKALAEVRTKEVREWQKKNIGQSVQSLRAKVSNFRK
jgi:hypothetical protein